jgi:RNA polymerase sigma-70 factor, ECF subfamily
LTDAQLLEQAQQGDSSAWQSLYERLLPSVWRAAHARMSDRDAAEDIVSETFLALVRYLPTLNPQTCRLYGWIHQVVRSKTADWVRRHNGGLKVLADMPQDGQAQDGDPAVAALVDEKRQLVVNVLEELRDDHRMVLELKYAEGLSVREIGERVGQPEGSVQSLLHRARLAFRQKYEVRNKDNMSAVLLIRNQGSP